MIRLCKVVLSSLVKIRRLAVPVESLFSCHSLLLVVADVFSAISEKKHGVRDPICKRF